jgi:hypothetical protein
MKDWIRIMLSPGSRLNIPKEDHHKFQIFAAVVCDLLWSYQNRVYYPPMPYKYSGILIRYL